MRCLALLLLFSVGCTSFGTNTSREMQIQEGKKEVTKSASETDLNTERTKPLVDATGSQNSTITVDVQGPLPVERVRGTQSKQASEDTLFDMTLAETWEQFSGWVYFLIAAAFAIFVAALKKLESTKTFQIAESSISGGLRVFQSMLSRVDSELVGLDTDDEAFDHLKRLRDDLAKKESSLKAKSRTL